MCPIFTRNEPALPHPGTRRPVEQRRRRQANNALYRIMITRVACHQPTKDYVESTPRRGQVDGEILRILKRYVAGEACKHVHPTATPA
jgi:hypothetical protein